MNTPAREIPVYLFTGFLEAGKTKFIQETFEDPRFRPLAAAEWPEVDFDISILGPTSPCPDIDLIELGRHGLMLEARGRTAVFLPQVPVEQGWSVKGTLEQLCRKASLPPGTWRDRTAVIYWYEATVIHP